MPIVSSTFEAPGNTSGVRHVVERHVDQDGIEYTAMWFADPGTDIQARVDARVIELNETLAEAEFEQMIGEI